MKLFYPFFEILKHDLLLAYRHKSDWSNAWLFFVLVVSLFPLAVTPDAVLLHTIAPGIVWVAALLSMLLALTHFLRPDYEDGSLNLLLLSPRPLPLIILAKMTAHWLMSGLPLILITPLLALSLHLSFPEILILLLSLLLGTPVLSMLGGIATALTVALGNQSLLLALLVLPLCVPVLIFGSGAVTNISLGLPINAPIALLGAFFTLTATLAPFTISAALKLGNSKDDTYMLSS